MTQGELRALILKAAGVEVASVVLDQDRSTDFWNVMETLYDVYIDKSRQYGDYVEEQLKDPEFAVADHFVNIRRKYTRARFQASGVIAGIDPPSVLIDTYADMAVYAILGILLASRMTPPPEGRGM